MSNSVETNIKPDYDQVLQDIADYVLSYEVKSENAFETARLCLMDTLGCGILALNFKECTKMLGPIVPNATLEEGARVPGTSYRLDPVRAAFNIGTMIRWLDFNDTWLAAEWGHPSDNLGAILAVADYLNRSQDKQITMNTVLEAMIKAHEIQGVMALENCFNGVGLDHVILVKLASTAVVTQLLGGDRETLLRALSHVFVDGQSLRTYRHAPNAGSRKSWAAGDATSRAVELALLTLSGEMGYPSCLTAPVWGFYDVSFKGNTFKYQRDYGTYVMENILFKLSFPAEFHAQTAVECAVILHPQVMDRLEDIQHIDLITHESAIRIISKKGDLHNPADRDHCLQYMVAIGLIFGDLKAEHYEDEVASDARIDVLRSKMRVTENKRYSNEYHVADKRSIANAMKIIFKDGSETKRIEIEYPIGHKTRRAEGVDILNKKFISNLDTHYTIEQRTIIVNACDNLDKLKDMKVDDFMSLWAL